MFIYKTNSPCFVFYPGAGHCARLENVGPASVCELDASLQVDTRNDIDTETDTSAAFSEAPTYPAEPHASAV